MKRIVRSVIFGGALVVCILLSLTQSVRANAAVPASSSRDYVGHIYFEPIYSLVIKAKSSDEVDLKEVIDWNNEGTLILHYTSDTSSAASIRFASYAVYVYTNDFWRNVWTMNGTGTSDPLLISTGFDPKGLAFTFPFKIRNLQLHPGYYGPVKDASYMVDEKITANGCVNKDLNGMNLLVQVNSGDSLGGSCTIPWWDGLPDSQITFTEKCKWTAHTITQSGGLVKPEWTTIK